MESKFLYGVVTAQCNPDDLNYKQLNASLEHSSTALTQFFPLEHELNESEGASKSLISTLIIPSRAERPPVVANAIRELGQQIMGDPEERSEGGVQDDDDLPPPLQGLQDDDDLPPPLQEAL